MLDKSISIVAYSLWAVCNVLYVLAVLLPIYEFSTLPFVNLLCHIIALCVLVGSYALIPAFNTTTTQERILNVRL